MTFVDLLSSQIRSTELGYDSLLNVTGQASADGGGISGVVWIGLVVLLLIIFVIVVRAFGPKKRDEVEDKKEEKKAVEAEKEKPALVDEKAPSLKEIKAQRAAKLTDDMRSKEAIFEARQARKGASRTEPEPSSKPAAKKTAKGEKEKDLPTGDADADAENVPKKAEADDKKSTAEKKQKKLKAIEFPSLEPVTSSEPPKPDPEPEPEPEPEQVQAKTLKEGLEKTRTGFVGRLKGLFKKKKKLDADLVEELEEVLLTADIGVKSSQMLFESVEQRTAEDKDFDSEKLVDLLREETTEILTKNEQPFVLGEERPFVVLVIGVNGVGKTTTIGKLASKWEADGKSVLMVAGDTFRAAAIDQLVVWGERTGCEVFKGPEGRDPSSVVFDAVKHAVSESIDIVLVDTAGRLHTKVNLVEELKKIRRVCGKALDGAPHACLLVLDANTGQNAINQADSFAKEVGVTGIVLTKLDGTAKGGVIIGISNELHVPVQFIGIGEQVEDLREFCAEDFVDALF